MIGFVASSSSGLSSSINTRSLTFHSSKCSSIQRSQIHSKVSMNSGSNEKSNHAVNRRDLLKYASLIGIPLLTSSFVFESQIESASADRDLMTAKRSYFRYATRFEAGVDYYVDYLYKAVSEADWNAINDAYVPKSNAQEGSKKAEYGIDRKVTDIQRLILDPMAIWAQSFAEKGTGPNVRYLNARVDTMDAQMKRLKKIADGKLGKEDEGLTREEAALDAWMKGKDAINEYIAKANFNLSRELRKLDTIPDDITAYQSHSKRPTPYGSF
mmetsp:Transcript_330/g.612  ORF Transcript_330/g.612 Transcript_330/m.612 type:complete len:270 (-) Transcript_330:3020-3829(-)